MNLILSFLVARELKARLTYRVVTIWENKHINSEELTNILVKKHKGYVNIEETQNTIKQSIFTCTIKENPLYNFLILITNICHDGSISCKTSAYQTIKEGMINMFIKIIGIFKNTLLEKVAYEGKSLDVKGFYF